MWTGLSFSYIPKLVMEALVLEIERKKEVKKLKACGVTERVLVAARHEVDINHLLLNLLWKHWYW